MSITVYPGDTFEAIVTGADTGLVGTMGVHIEDMDGAIVLARTTAGIEESPNGSGIYNVSLEAPLETGEYLLVWDTGVISPETTTAEQLTVTQLVAPLLPSSEGWVPAVETVGALLRARTQDADGNEVGTFNDDTRPTRSEVLTFIAMSAARLVSCAGAWLPELMWPMSQYTIALGACLLIEQSYWPEQIETDQSPYKLLKELYTEAVITLCNAAAGFRPDDIPVPGEGEGGERPLWYFGDGDLVATTAEWDYVTQRWIFRGEPGVFFIWNS